VEKLFLQAFRLLEHLKGTGPHPGARIIVFHGDTSLGRRQQGGPWATLGF
jgi:hypothetical protein